MKPSSSKQFDSILSEFQAHLAELKEKQASLVKKIRKSISVGKLKRIKKELGMSK